MKIVLLPGNSDKNVWSIDKSRSKHYIKEISNTNDEYQIIDQRLWKQLIKNNLVDDTVITISKNQTELLRKQLGNSINIVQEPEHRDTLPAIALVASYLYSEMSCTLDEIVVILPTDTFIEDVFFERLFVLEDLIKSTSSDLALMGVKPVMPSKYGYIVPEASTANGTMYVKRLIEKPKENHGKELIEEGALCNYGVFAFELLYIIKMLRNNRLPTDYRTLCENYNLLDKHRFNCEAIKRAVNITVTKYDIF